jgi:hypothetical protein
VFRVAWLMVIIIFDLVINWLSNCKKDEICAKLARVEICAKVARNDLWCIQIVLKSV